MASITSPIFDEVYDFLVSSPSLQEVIAFRPSTETQERASKLLELNQHGDLTELEQMELEEFMSVEHVVRMLKIKARQKLGDD